MQPRFSAEPPRIATRIPQVSRAGRARHVGRWVLQTVMLPGVARHVDNCQKCRIGVRNVGDAAQAQYNAGLLTRRPARQACSAPPPPPPTPHPSPSPPCPPPPPHQYVVYSVPGPSIVPARLPSGRGEQRQHLDPKTPVTGDVPPNRCATESAAAYAPVSPPGPHPGLPHAPCAESPAAGAGAPPAGAARSARRRQRRPALAAATRPVGARRAGPVPALRVPLARSSSSTSPTSSRT